MAQDSPAGKRARMKKATAAQDVAAAIRQFNAGRDPQRLALKFRKMRASPFSFLRGACHLFHDRLPRAEILEKAPPSWVCGDLHFENFGSFKGDNRLVYFDINDFDEAVLAPCTWDLARFLTSVLVGAGSLAVGDAEAMALCRIFLDAYADALAAGKARWVERETSEGMVRQLFDSLHGRLRPQFLDSRTVLRGRRRRLRLDGRKALPVGARQRAKVERFMAEFADRQPDPRFFKVLDVARRIAGTGSLGVDRYVILVRGKGSPDGNYLLDLKQAMPSSLLPRLGLRQPRWASEAERVVAVQRRMQAVPMAFLNAVQIGRTPYVLRGLQPTEDRVALADGNGAVRRLAGVMRCMGEIVAWSHLRSGGRQGSAIADELIDFGQRQKWRAALIEIAAACRVDTVRDWTTFAAAYDAGGFSYADQPGNGG